MRVQHVLVAGAGLAGLCAARELAASRCTVTIIDGRERPGGRVWTMRDGFAGGQYGELGAEFIDAEQREIRDLASALGLATVRVLRSGFMHRFRCDERQWCVSRTRPWDALRENLAPLLRQYKAADRSSGADLYGPRSNVREFATISLGEWLRRHDASCELHAMADALRGFFLADAEELSVLQVVEQLAQGGSPARAEMYRIVGGSDRLIDALVRATPAKLLLRHRLEAISRATDRVIAHVEDEHGQRQQIEADAMVVTLPASTLRLIDIQPALSDDQWHAINRLPYGRATKAVVQSPRDIFAGHRARAFATDGGVGAFWDATEGQPASSATMTLRQAQGHPEPGRGVISFLAGGSASGQLRDRARAGADTLLSELCWLRTRDSVVGSRQYAEASGSPQQLQASTACRLLPTAYCRSCTWEDDPWSRGGYAFIDPGFDPAWRPLLSRRAGRLVFAGEHTSARWQGYMNGAVESGIRAARELVAE